MMIEECGCACHSCFGGNSLDLHHQIEELNSKLRQSNAHIAQMEKDFEASRLYSEQEISKLQDELLKLRDRYDRLYESHKKLSKVNQGLEDKLLKVVSKFEVEKTALQKDIANLTSRMVEARMTISELEEENDRYRNDCNVAVQLLQCKPNNFVAHKLNTLPLDLQNRLRPHLTREEIINMDDGPQSPQQDTQKTIRVPMPTFPPTAMVYSVNQKVNTVQVEVKQNDSSVPMTLIAKVLTQSEPRKRQRRIYICDKCKRDFVFMDKGIQADIRPLTRRDSDSDNASYSSNGSMHIHKPSRPRLNSTETEI
ncbi:brain-enriched guanylate kinase-associated protein-like isoform X2 [Lineus longissimus]|uniref:brain-enriched guanylate kinase-associated protein-like isoform X2 n=1 Tax=Lineus longissimus TaxID=88925 RepID=UPI002B4FA5D4